MVITIVNANQSNRVYRDVISRNGAMTQAERKAEFQKTLEQKANEANNSSTENSYSSTNFTSPINSTSNVSSVTNSDVEKITNQLKPIEVPSSLMPIFEKASKTYNVDMGYLIAMAKQESNFRTDATSSAGAMGVMQLMPKTAEALGVTNAYDPEQNIMAGAKLLSGHLEKYNGNISLALASYSAGGGAVKKYDGIPPYTETQNHIPRVLLNYARGYKSDASDEVILPDAANLASKVVEYKNTKGSAFDSSVEVSDRQKEDLKKLLLIAINGNK
ncbi:MAG: lytic transglycosylase domain-containing protein [Lachnospiraceae bacterium]|nr:lytic transglycosylase domain-containing protein [Lachnospiraceae bacterium]